ncbi:LrgB family protein [Escherichia coli]|uniref:LrgB family protein n=1 Tax=Escherichia coli TaxID=562 RepID=UPI00249E880A|nr:LrgB family protein [Escherichia coli]WGY50600.1 LrgB family protein [Escherichia coli]WGY59835.1 LrgB family protein [Escherichia coli]
MEIFFTILIMTLVVSLSGVVTRVMPFQIPLPLMQIAIGALLAWPTFGLHVEFDPELFLVLFIPPLLFADGWKTPTREFLEHGREIFGLALALVVVTGVFGMAIGDVLFLRLSIREGMAKGAGFGAASHGAGTARSYELGQQEGVVASLVMMLSGVLMVLVSPLVARMMF